MGPITREKF